MDHPCQFPKAFLWNVLEKVDPRTLSSAAATDFCNSFIVIAGLQVASFLSYEVSLHYEYAELSRTFRDYDCAHCILLLFLYHFKSLTSCQVAQHKSITGKSQV